MAADEHERWYPKLIRSPNWEVPVPGREAVVGFFVVLAASLLLHLSVVWICSLFREG